MRDRILRFVEDIVAGPTAARVEERIAVFENDGTLCAEKPMPPRLHFLLEQSRQRADDDPELRAEQPDRAASEGDLAWIADALARHHDGDDADMRPLLRAILGGLAGLSVEYYSGEVGQILRGRS